MQSGPNGGLWLRKRVQADGTPKHKVIPPVNCFPPTVIGNAINAASIFYQRLFIANDFCCCDFSGRPFISVQCAIWFLEQPIGIDDFRGQNVVCVPFGVFGAERNKDRKGAEIDKMR